VLKTPGQLPSGGAGAAPSDTRAGLVNADADRHLAPTRGGGGLNVNMHGAPSPLDIEWV